MIPAIILLGILAMPASGEVSMSSQIVSGEILDNRVASCGVEVRDGPMVTLRPFMEASGELSGSFTVIVTKKSRSGKSTTRQGGNFGDGRFGGNLIGVDRAPVVGIDLQVTAGDGTPLCRLTRDLEFGDEAIRL